MPDSSTSKAVWGPIYWNLLHCCADNYENASDFQVFIDRFTESIQCAQCHEHFVAAVEKSYPRDKPDRVDIQRLFWKQHNAVNRMLKKPLFEWDDYVRSIEQRQRSKETIRKKYSDWVATHLQWYQFDFVDNVLGTDLVNRFSCVSSVPVLSNILLAIIAITFALFLIGAAARQTGPHRRALTGFFK